MSLLKASWPRYLVYGLAFLAIACFAASLLISEAVFIEYNPHHAATDLKTLQTSLYLNIFGGLFLSLLALLIVRMFLKRFGNFIDATALLAIVVSYFLVTSIETGTVEKSAQVALGEQVFLIPYTFQPYSREKPLLEGAINKVERFDLGNFFNRPQFTPKTYIHYSSIVVDLKQDNCVSNETDIDSYEKSSTFDSDGLCFRIIWHETFDADFVKAALRHDKPIIIETVLNLRAP